jgi:hypothetical protein
MSVEQRAHVVDAVDRDACHADVAAHARVIRVVAAVRREVEGDRKALLSCGDVATVEGVAVLGRREAGVLANRPGLSDVHGGVGTPHVGCNAGPRVEKVEAARVGTRVNGIEFDALGRDPGLCGRPIRVVCRSVMADAVRLAGAVQLDLGEVGDAGHRSSGRGGDHGSCVSWSGC